MTPCREYEPLIAARVADALGPDAGARLAAHLGACSACRAEAAALSEALALAALPPPSGAAAGALEGLDRETLRAWRGRERSRAPWRRAGMGFAVAVAAAAVMVVVPALRTTPPPAPAPVSPAADAWKEPDLDALWAATALADPAASDEDVASGEVALYADEAALDALPDLSN